MICAPWTLRCVQRQLRGELVMVNWNPVFLLAVLCWVLGSGRSRIDS